MRHRSNKLALRTSLLYAGIAALWILLSDKAMRALVSNPELIARLEIYKGWAFVLLTASLLYWVLRHHIRRWEQESAGHKLAEESLALSRRLMKQTNDGIEVVDPATGRFVDVNEKTCEDLGYTYEEMLSLTVSDIDPAVTAASRLETLKQLRKNGSLIIEGVHRRKDGSTFPVELNKKLVRLDREYVVAVARNITDRRKAQQALRESERRFSAVFHHSPIGIVITRLTDGSIVEVNDAFAGIHGYTREEMIGRRSTELQAWAEPAERETLAKQLLNQGTVKDFDIKVRKKNRELRQLRASAELIDLDGELFMLGMARDVTERKGVEEVLRESEERLRQIVTHTRCILNAGEASGPAGWRERALEAHSPFQWNFPVQNEKVAQEICPLELQPGEHYQQAWVRSRHSEDHAQMNRDSGNAFLHDQPFYRTEFRCTDRDGAEHWMLQHVTVKKLAENRWQIFGITTDVTGLKNAGESLRKTNRALQMISDCNQTLIRATNEADLLKDICRLVVETGGYAMTWVGEAVPDETRSVRPAAQAGSDTSYLDKLRVTWADEPRGRGPVGIAIRTGKPSIFRDLGRNPAFALWREEALRHGYQAVISLPLAAGGQVLGALTIYSTQENAFDEAETGLLQELAGDLAFGINTLRARAEYRQTDEALRRSEERLRLAQAAAKIGIFDVDLIRDHATWTEEEEAIFGFSPGTYDHTSDTFWRLVHPEDRGRIRQLANDASVQRREFHAEYRFHRHGDGALRWTLVRGKTIYDENGHAVRMIGVNIDITDQKQAEAALQMSEALYHSLVAQMPLGIFRKDAAGRYVFVNPLFCRLKDLTEAEFLNKDALEVAASGPAKRDETGLATKYAARGAELHRLIMETGVSVEEEEEYSTPAGDKKFMHVVRSPVKDPDGKIIGTQGILFDVTQLKQAEDSHRRLATAVEQAAEAIMITDASARILYVNPAFESITGYSEKEVIGQNPRFLQSGRQDTVFYRRMWEVLVRGEVWSGRITNKRKDGTLFEEESTISPIRDATGNIINYVGVKRDVTRELALENQLRQSQKMEAIGQLAGGVAHDFNNLLTAIHGNASLLLEPQLKPAELAECSQQILEAAERAAALTRQLLLFSRKQVMQPANLDLNEVVAQITKMLRRILGEDVSLTTNFAPGLPAIRADAGMIEQVILNLAVNARDAMPQGGHLIISTGTEITRNPEANPDAASGPHVWLDVADSGCGIAPEVLPRIFEPFFTTKEVGKGTGLGLATVYGIVRQHLGWINVRSELKQGTTFRLYFPAVPEADTQKRGGAAIVPLPRGTETILVVEDESPVRLMVSHLLQRCGYTVLQAESGRAALKVWQEHQDRIQLLLTDIIMPDGVTGFDLARQLQADRPQLKIIFTSGYSGEEVDKRLALVEGVNFLQKPYAPQKLAAALRKNLDAK